MSWDLLIYRPGSNPSDALPFGTPEDVRIAINSEFPQLRWTTDSEASLDVDRDFQIFLHAENGLVTRFSTRGGYDHLPLFAKLCEENNWVLFDMQFGEPVDLKHPYSRYEGDA